VLPRQHRLNRSADLRHTMRRGRRFVIPSAVVSVLKSDSIPTRIGVITPRAIGNSVVRHRVARAIRHGAADFLTSQPQGFDIAVRALPGADKISVSEWSEILSTAVSR
jgi:ribonuclease P protein component